MYISTLCVCEGGGVRTCAEGYELLLLGGGGGSLKERERWRGGGDRLGC